MDNINKLIAMLMAIAGYSKDIHYTASGDAFLSKHQLADRVYDGINDQIDSIKEVFFLGNNLLPLTSAEYQISSVAFIPQVQKDNDQVNFEELALLINSALTLIDNLTDLGCGENNLVGGVAESLQQKLGLIYRQNNVKQS